MTILEALINLRDDIKEWVTNNLKTKSDTSHTHSYAGSSSVGGSATSAVKLDSSAGSATQPIYFSSGKPVATTYALNKTVPSDAKFTDTVYSHPSYTARTGKPTANQTPAFGGTVTISQPVSDATGHITAMNDRTITIPSTEATSSSAGLMSATDKGKLNNMWLSTYTTWDTLGVSDYSTLTSWAGVIPNRSMFTITVNSSESATLYNNGLIPVNASGTLLVANFYTRGYAMFINDAGVADFGGSNNIGTTNITWGAARKSNSIKVADKNPTSSTGYPIPFTSSSEGYNVLVKNDGLYYTTREGTADANGVAVVTIGNSTASGTAGNKQGRLRLYANTKYFTDLFAASDLAANRSIYLPSSGGTLALTSQFSGYLPLSGGTLTGSLNANGGVDINSKVILWSDNEGGNIKIVSPNGVEWNFDAYNDDLRIFAKGTDGVNEFFSFNRNYGLFSSTTGGEFLSANNYTNYTVDKNKHQVNTYCTWAQLGVSDYSTLTSWAGVVPLNSIFTIPVWSDESTKLYNNGMIPVNSGGSLFVNNSNRGFAIYRSGSDTYFGYFNTANEHITWSSPMLTTAGGTLTGNLVTTGGYFMVEKNDPYIYLKNTGGGNNSIGFHYYGSASGANTFGVYDYNNSKHLLTIAQSDSKATFGGGAAFNGNVSIPDKTYFYLGGATMWTNGSQALYIKSGSEDAYAIKLGVTDESWAFHPYKDYYLTLGSPNNRWAQIYSSVGSISTSDRRNKTDLCDIDEDQIVGFISELEPLFYRLKDVPNITKQYAGLIAQDVEEAMKNHNIPEDFGLLDKTPRFDEDGNETGDYSYGLSYEQLITPLIKMSQRHERLIQEKDETINELKTQLKEQESRIQALEAAILN